MRAKYSAFELTHWPHWKFRQVIFKLILVNNGGVVSCEITLRWMPLDLTDKLKLVQVMVWCRQALSHYLNQCWPIFKSPNGFTRPQWLDWIGLHLFNDHTSYRMCRRQINAIQSNSINRPQWVKSLIYICVCYYWVVRNIFDLCY